jgi:hypothetical protein
MSEQVDDFAVVRVVLLLEPRAMVALSRIEARLAEAERDADKYKVEAHLLNEERDVAFARAAKYEKALLEIDEEASELLRSQPRLAHVSQIQRIASAALSGDTGEGQ